MKKIAKMILSALGYKVGKNRKIIPHLFRNVFRSTSSPRALLSYVTYPFYTESDMSHTNYHECRIAAMVFDQLGYTVDVVDHDADIKINYDLYDVIYGMGKSFEKSFLVETKRKQKRIFYATGCNPNYSNSATILRLRDFLNTHGFAPVESTRFIKESQHCQILLSDTVIVLGNEFVLSTYTDLDPTGIDRYKRLNAFYYDVNQPSFGPDFSKKRKNFLWFGSSGLIHKGLDVLLEYFATQSDYRLHICGIQRHELKFIRHFSQELTSNSSIIDHGFVDLRSNKFKEIIQSTGFVIFPSVSEGGAAAILNVVANGGLIPILTQSTGLDIQGFGRNISNISKNGIAQALDDLRSISDQELNKMTKIACETIRSQYSMQTYSDQLYSLIVGAVAI